FPAAIAQSVPVRGVRISGAGPFMLPAVPRGTYRLLAAVIPFSADPIAQLLPDRAIQVAADPEPLTIQSGHERIHRTLTLRSLRKVDPPILTALPALAVNQAAQAWR
ncbi:MAG: AraC family transcriptional regulator, partial [Chloroflexota bacterium]|nr:AraC family transcriptional regulator [Chloroflexota bacterium]